MNAAERPLVVVLESQSLPVELPRPREPHRWASYPASTPAEVVPRLAQATVAVINKVRLDAPVLAQLPVLRMIALSATGADNVDLEACRARGIVVSNVRGYARDTVPEHALLLMLALRRNLVRYVDDVRAGRWARSPQFGLFDHPVGDLAGSTLVIVGRGGLGEGLATRAQALGMQICFAERKNAPAVRPGYVAFTDALARADVLSLHCPLDATTRGLIGPAELAAMKPSAILVNTARGGLVDAAALARALREGRLAGAAVDVLEHEPPPADHPLLAADIPNLIVTPHMAWASQQAAAVLAATTMANVAAFLAGQPANRLS